MVFHRSIFIVEPNMSGKCDIIQYQMSTDGKIPQVRDLAATGISKQQAENAVKILNECAERVRGILSPPKIA
jgi:hypothetical protein